MVEILGPAWDAETDPEARAALASALEITHRRLHEQLRPDETAEGPRLRGGPGQGPGRQSQRPVDRHSLAASLQAPRESTRPPPRALPQRIETGTARERSSDDIA